MSRLALFQMLNNPLNSPCLNAVGALRGFDICAFTMNEGFVLNRRRGISGLSRYARFDKSLFMTGLDLKITADSAHFPEQRALDRLV